MIYVKSLSGIDILISKMHLFLPCRLKKVPSNMNPAAKGFEDAHVNHLKKYKHGNHGYLDRWYN